MDLSDPFEQFRKNKSYTFNRRTASAGKLQMVLQRQLLIANINPECTVSSLATR